MFVPLETEAVTQIGEKLFIYFRQYEPIIGIRIYHRVPYLVQRTWPSTSDHQCYSP